MRPPGVHGGDRVLGHGGEKVCVGEEYTFTRRGLPFHPIGHIYLVELGEKRTEGEPGHELVWLPVEECREKMALAYQSWAVEKAWEYYKKHKRRNYHDNLR